MKGINEDKTLEDIAPFLEITVIFVPDEEGNTGINIKRVRNIDRRYRKILNVTYYDRDEGTDPYVKIFNQPKPVVLSASTWENAYNVNATLEVNDLHNQTGDMDITCSISCKMNDIDHGNARVVIVTLGGF